MAIVTRFAPSPTGFLHVGSARTALFNWLYARHHNGVFLLRIEDTDRVRSTQKAIDAILESMSWMGLTSEHPPYFQSQHAEHHCQVALKLLKEGKAYKCYCTAEQLQAMREQANEQKRRPGYDGRCRGIDEQDLPYVDSYTSCLYKTASPSRRLFPWAFSELFSTLHCAAKNLLKMNWPDVSSTTSTDHYLESR